MNSLKCLSYFHGRGSREMPFHAISLSFKKRPFSEEAESGKKNETMSWDFDILETRVQTNHL